MDPRKLSRLQEEQIKAISETDVTIEQVEHFKQDYKSLQERLRTLPDKLTHDIMVPFGKLAFMPGQLTHTNEILVLLGDNWFVERSAKQATDIIDRRIKELDLKLTDLKAQQKLLQPRLGLTSDLQAEIQGHGEVKEIVEEYDESTEKLWDEQHRKNVKKYKEELRKHSELQKSQEKKEDTPISQDQREDRQNSQDRRENRQKTDEYLWSRLDELERQEARRGELRNLPGGEESNDEDQGESQVKVGSSNSRHTERRVSWADNVNKATEIQQENDESGGEFTDDDDDDDDDDDEDDDADSEADESGDDGTRTVRTPVRRTITFTHSATPFVLPYQVSEGNDLTIHSPADIYKLYCPKSILKKTVDNEDVSNVNKNTESSLSNVQSVDKSRRTSNVKNKPQTAGFASSLSTTPTSGMTKAFTGLVVEKMSDLSAAAATTEIPPSCATATDTTTQPPVKRVSKFKSSRQNQTS